MGARLGQEPFGKRDSQTSSLGARQLATPTVPERLEGGPRACFYLLSVPGDVATLELPRACDVTGPGPCMFSVWQALWPTGLPLGEVMPHALCLLTPEHASRAFPAPCSVLTGAKRTRPRAQDVPGVEETTPQTAMPSRSWDSPCRLFLHLSNVSFFVLPYHSPDFSPPQRLD